MSKASPNLRKLIDANAPLWAAEAELCRTYFHSPKRTVKTDLFWLARQARKEFFDSFDADRPSQMLIFCKDMLEGWDKIDRGGPSRHEIQDKLESIAAEYRHYVAFADAYEAIRGPDDPPITLVMVREMPSWPENDALTRLRTNHRRDHGVIGVRASHFTEGGYCQLFVEGMKLNGRSKGDDAIAHACSLAYEDEFGQILSVD